MRASGGRKSEVQKKRVSKAEARETRVIIPTYLSYPLHFLLLALQLLLQQSEFCMQLCNFNLHVAPTHTPAEQTSLVVAALPSLHTEPLGSLAVQVSAISLHDSEQSTSPSAPGHGLPA